MPKCNCATDSGRRARSPGFVARLLVVLLVSTLVVSSVQAQTGAAPVVAFVVDRDLGTASHTDLGAVGLNRLAETVRAYGAEVTTIDLSSRISDAVDLVVLVRPTRPLTIAHAARLWLYLHNGGNLLLAVDPENYYIGSANINPQIARSGLTTLLTLDYGILVRDAFLVEPWFTVDSITRLETTYTRTFVDVVPHPVVAPLTAFDLPVWVWGARPLGVEPFGIDSQAVPLLYNNLGYGEASPRVFRVLRGNRYQNATDPLQENIGADFLGWLNVAALAENTSSGSRIVVLGDSELLLNGYGFAGTPQARIYPGNVLFAQNLVGWLLEFPAGRWIGLPPGFTWVTIDGGAQEWPESASLVADAVDPGVAASLDIKQVRAFHDDAYVYLFIETWDRPPTDARLSLVTSAENGGARIEISEGVFHFPAGSNERQPAVDGARVELRSGFELRLPQRLVSAGITDVCLQGPASADSGIADCLGQPVPVPAFNTRAPFDLGLARGLLVTASNNTDVNLRSGPGTATTVVASIPNGTVFTALGRNAEGTWLQVQNAGHTGWISAGLVVANGDIQSLPIVDSEG